MDKSLLSHWWRQMESAHGGVIPERAPLTENIEVDVAIVGAGYTGLWTALELVIANPDLRVAVLEAHVAGYGASGRNGGAAVAQVNGSRAFWEKRGGGRDASIRMERAIQDSVYEIGKAVEREGIDCGYAANGILMVARTPLEAENFREGIRHDRDYGFSEDDSRYLDRDEVLARINIAGALGARWSAHCASVDGGRLVRGLADAVERHGGVIYENSPVTRIEPHRAHTVRGIVTASFVIRATEAYGGSLAGEKRSIVPIHTSMLATEVLTDDQMSEIRWSNHEALLAEHPFLHLQFTDDNRVTIGGDDPRIPYQWGSGTGADGPASPKVVAHYMAELVKLFPFLDGVRVDSSWQGVFGTTKRWAPSVSLDRSTGLGAAGGYVGEGVVASNLAGRTMRDLVLGQDTELTQLPWVNMRARKWEPEPLRLVGAGVIWAARSIGDAKELRTDRPSRLVALGNRAAGFTGHLG